MRGRSRGIEDTAIVFHGSKFVEVFGRVSPVQLLYRGPGSPISFWHKKITYPGVGSGD